MLEVGFVALGAVLAGIGISISVRSTTPIRRMSSAIVIASGAAVGLVTARSATSRSNGVSAALVLVVAIVAEVGAGFALVLMARASGSPALDSGSDAIGGRSASGSRTSAHEADGSGGAGGVLRRATRHEQGVVSDRDERRDRGSDR